MIIRRITVDTVGMPPIVAEPCDGVSIIKTNHSDLLSHAMEIILHGGDENPPPEYRVGVSGISAVVTVEGTEYTVHAKRGKRRYFQIAAFDKCGNDATEEYQYLCKRCPEQNQCEGFNGDEGWYRTSLARFFDGDTEGRRELSERSGGYSDIKAFRHYLWHFKKDFTPELLRVGKPYSIILRDDGVYDVEGDGVEVFLSESEQRMFRYICFLRTAEFWHGFENLRNMHSTKRPLVITNFLERLDESIEIQPLLDRAAGTGRQVILLTR